jgi:hypothetical protein
MIETKYTNDVEVAKTAWLALDVFFKASAAGVLEKDAYRAAYQVVERFDRRGKCEGCGLNCAEWCPDVVKAEIAQENLK